MIRNDPARALAVTAGAVIIALTAAAFWLSYAHLAEVALAHGMEDKEIRAWAWPATLDLFIVAGELLMLRAALAGRVDGWAIGLTIVGSGGSIALNVAGVGVDAGLLEYTVAAVPPTAALLAFGALMRQIHQALAGHAESPVEAAPVVEMERVPDAVPETYLEIAAPVPGIPEAVPAGVALLPTFDCPGELRRALRPEAPEPVLAAAPPRTRAEVHAEYVPEETEAADESDEPEAADDGFGNPLSAVGYGLAAEQFKGQLLDGNLPSIRDIKNRLRVGQTRAKEIQDAFRTALPQLTGTGVSS
ncbi:DUF2637 domain-containing protein [Streptomyces cavernae]|uniref:DUF2637 domain-containing protein n=1 Tax=Streptomyces cavernae TaxID=2259034 RepID=UPI000FEBC0CE|nr:DUF2637 domain-containing protein [Streptomyces cavernae]